MFTEKLLLSFTGDKASMKKQLQKWCEKNGKSMNGTVLELIKNHLKKVNR